MQARTQGLISAHATITTHTTLGTRLRCCNLYYFQTTELLSRLYLYS